MSCNCIELEVVENVPIDFNVESGGVIVPRDYNILVNKPKINDKELEGNHDGEYYGLVNYVEGKVLSDNNFTNEEKEKLDNLGFYLPKITNAQIDSLFE